MTTAPLSVSAQEETPNDFDADGNLVPRQGTRVPTREQFADYFARLAEDIGGVDASVSQPLAEEGARYLDALYPAKEPTMESPCDCFDPECGYAHGSNRIHRAPVFDNADLLGWVKSLGFEGMAATEEAVFALARIISIAAKAHADEAVRGRTTSVVLASDLSRSSPHDPTKANA